MLQVHLWALALVSAPFFLCYAICKILTWCLYMSTTYLAKPPPDLSVTNL
jgi:hypothetical protein